MVQPIDQTSPDIGACPRPDGSHKALLAQFESLGDNCEFGFVQRYFGVEPVSLLRWAGISCSGLQKGLANDFDRLFAFEDIAPGGPTVTADPKYSMVLHTQIKIARTERGFVFAAETPEQLAKIHAKESMRIGLLRRKFFEDLDSGERIYVFKSTAGMPLAQILLLRDALERRRPQRLLCVVPASPDRPAGSVALAAERVKIAGLSRFAPGDRAKDADYAGWLDICCEAAATPWG